MKNINKYILGLALVVFAGITACEDEVMVPVDDNKAVDSLFTKVNDLETELFTLDVANNAITITNRKLQDSVSKLNQDPKISIDYTVNVMTAANTAFSNARVAGVNGATVTLHQNGQNFAPVTTTDGIAIFKGLKEADVLVSVSAPGYSRVEFSAILSDNEEGTSNASSNVVLYPLDGATIKGRVLANLNTENDTLGRMYQTGVNAGKYMTQPGLYNHTNYTQWDANMIYEISNIYTSFPQGSQVAFEKIPSEKVKLHFYPQDFKENINNHWYAGEIYSITYYDMIKTVSPDAEGNYEVKVPTSMAGLTYNLEVETVVADHTRLTDNQGTSIETGSVLKTVKKYDLATNTTSNVDIRTITQQWTYRPVIYSPYTTNYLPTGVVTVDSNLSNGETTTVNIFFFPYFEN